MKKLIIGVIALAALAGGGWQWRDYQAKRLRLELEQQVTRYWDAVIANDHWTVYQLEAGRQSGELTPDAFYDAQVSRAVEIVGYSVENIDQQGDRAKVQLDILKTFAALRGANYAGGINDAWIRIDNQWLHDTPKASGSGDKEAISAGEKRVAPIPQVAPGENPATPAAQPQPL